MLETEEYRAREAARARDDRILLYLHDVSPHVIRALLTNGALTEDHLLIIAGRKNLPGEILDSIFKDRRWTESYPIKLTLARNPKTPLFTALSLARSLRLFDLADLVRNASLSIIFRRKIEAIIVEKVPTLALGVKKTLAKTAAGDVLLSLIRDGYPEVVKICLDNPFLVESSLYKVINRAATGLGAIRAISEHPNWSSRYHIRFALIRNGHTPLARIVNFLPAIRIRELKELYLDPFLPPAVRPAIHRELVDRNEEPDNLKTLQEDPVYEIGEHEWDEIDEEAGIGRQTASQGEVAGEAPEGSE